MKITFRRLQGLQLAGINFKDALRLVLVKNRKTARDITQIVQNNKDIQLLCKYSVAQAACDEQGLHTDYSQACGRGRYPIS